VPVSGPSALTDPLDARLGDDMGKLALEPEKWLQYAFRWGHGPLEGQSPDRWQLQFFEDLGRAIRERKFNHVDPVDPILMAVASGHGIGKSALSAWLVLFILSTRPRSIGMITANTGEQLRGKTMAAIVKWKELCIVGHWFEASTGDLWIRHKDHPATWRADCVTWRENRPEAFAGLHAASSTPFYIFDESSGIPDVIWDTAEGGLTDGEPIFVALGNPTRNSGRFHALFGARRHRWNTRQIDARDCRLPNKRLHQEWIQDHGVDSDFVRVKVRGLFPMASSRQLIPSDLVAAGRTVPPRCLISDPIVIGVDVARYGDDESVIACRKGRDARSIPWKYYRGLNTMQLASRIIEFRQDLESRGLRVSAMFIDATGIGAGVIDRLAQLEYDPIEVHFGSTNCAPAFKRKDAEMWVAVREWLRGGGAIPDDDVLAKQLEAREYDYDAVERIYLESKEDMKERGEESPDRADALALTFTYPIGSTLLEDVPKPRHYDYDPREERDHGRT
jgi:hypothetical protein